MDRDTAEKIAHLARIRLRPDEAKVYAGQLTGILAYVEQLKEVDIDGAAPFTHAVELTNVLRSDLEEPGLTQEEALADAPDRAGGYFRVPRVLESGR